VPYDSKSYVHRIGRTGRAGRSGEAILFIASRERNMLRIIERATRQTNEPMNMLSILDVNAKRAEKFKKQVGGVISTQELSPYRGVIEEFVRESGADVFDVAAALASLAKSGRSLFITKRSVESGEKGARAPEIAGGDLGTMGRKTARPPSAGVSAGDLSP